MRFTDVHISKRQSLARLQDPCSPSRDNPPFQATTNLFKSSAFHRSIQFETKVSVNRLYSPLESNCDFFYSQIWSISWCTFCTNIHFAQVYMLPLLFCLPFLSKHRCLLFFGGPPSLASHRVLQLAAILNIPSSVQLWSPKESSQSSTSTKGQPLCPYVEWTSHEHAEKGTYIIVNKY